MNGQLKILHLEDSKIDAELVRTRLEEDGLPSVIDWVDTQDAYAARLERGAFDVILADYTLPSFDGLSALRMTRERYPDVPFIFVSGTIGEDRAVETFKNGATDYVLKGHLSRLVPSIRRALKENEERSERRRAEESLRESEMRFSKVFRSSPVGIVISRLSDGTCYDVNESFLSVYGYARDEIIGSTSLELNMWVDLEDRARMISAVREKGHVRNLEAKFRKKSGEVGDLLISAELIELAGEECLLGTFSDITALKSVEAELQKSAQQWNNTFDAMNDAISIMDERGSIVRCNKAMIQLLDKFPQDIVNHPCWEVVHHAEARIADCPFIKMKQSRRRETATIRQYGRWFNVIADPIIDQSGRLVGGVHIMTDITEHRRFEEQLRESENKFRSLAEQSLVGTYIIQNDLFKYVNPRFAEMFGFSPDEIIEHMGPKELAVPEDRHIIDTVESWTKSGEPVSHYEARGLKKSGEVMHAEIFGSRAHYQGRPSIIGIVLDITEKKKLEVQLLQAQKMEAVGQLTGGIAHDFNNILSAIIGYASFLQMKMKRDDPFFTYVDQILASSERAANLTRSLLTFSRKQITNLAPVNVNDALRKVQVFLQRIIGEDVDLRSDLSPADLIVNADTGQLEQVLLNLATNARDAMPDGGILTLRTELVGPASSGGTSAAEKLPACALIMVADTGVGMDDATREKIFEPFFTTKELGRGTGLGLAMVYGIIRQHGGRIECASESGKGTTFRIYLPLASTGEAGEAAGGTRSTTADPLRGSETILVVEDDEAVRKFSKIALETFGYTVIEAADGEEAITLYRKHRDAIRLVLCDVIMPKKSGADVLKTISSEAAGARFLFMSGYPADIVHRQNILSEGTEVIAKPISPSTLLNKVREVLDRP